MKRPVGIKCVFPVHPKKVALLYKEDYPVGSWVRIANVTRLKEFLRTWKYHHQLQPSQLNHAGSLAEVVKVGFYHGGDVLYELREVPGIWHKECLEPATEKEK